MAPWVRTGVVVLALALAGCSEQLERMPEQLGGMPADAPARPKAPYQYPAVHDVPAARAVKPMSDAELLKLENELKAARDRQQKEAGQTPASAGNPQKP
jgi:hypothetical protein